MSRPSLQRSGRLVRGLAGLAIGLVLALAVAEVVLRAAGATPYAPRASIANEPVVHDPDAVLGWRTRPGAYVIPPYVAGGAPITVTVLPDGSRATSAGKPDTSRDVLLLLGCSFTFGWAISDDETMAWHLQDALPATRVVNRGVNAYGTYQALLLLEELLARGERPARVIYNFHEVHEERNVAAPRWLQMLDQNARRGNVEVPHATVDAAGALERHPPARHPTWPLRTRLATPAFLESIWSRWHGEARVAQARAVTEQLLLAMRDLCARAGVPFQVVLLQAQPAVRQHYRGFLARSGIDVTDCVVPITPDLRVPGEGHPNGIVHARWAACVAHSLASAESAGS